MINDTTNNEATALASTKIKQNSISPSLIVFSELERRAKQNISPSLIVFSEQYIQNENANLKRIKHHSLCYTMATRAISQQVVVSFEHGVDTPDLIPTSDDEAASESSDSNSQEAILGSSSTTTSTILTPSKQKLPKSILRREQQPTTSNYNKSTTYHWPFSSRPSKPKRSVHFPTQRNRLITSINTRPRTHILDVQMLYYRDFEIKRFKREYRKYRKSKKKPGSKKNESKMAESYCGSVERMLMKNSSSMWGKNKHKERSNAKSSRGSGRKRGMVLSFPSIGSLSIDSSSSSSSTTSNTSSESSVYSSDGDNDKSGYWENQAFVVAAEKSKSADDSLDSILKGTSIYTRSTASSQQHDVDVVGKNIQNSKFHVSFKRIKGDMSINSASSSSSSSSSGSGDFISFTDITRTILSKEDKKTQTVNDACVGQQLQQQGQEKEEKEEDIYSDDELIFGPWSFF